MSWIKVEIGDLVTLRQGFAINKKTKHHMSEVPTKLHLLRIGDMKDGNFSIYVKDTIPEKFIAKEDDIIYTRTGQVGLVFRRQHGVVHNNCFTVSSNNNEVLMQEFLFYALQDRSFYEEAISRATGAAQPDLPHGAFNSIKIFLPPIEIQKKIIDYLDTLNALIENNQKQIKLLEEAAQRLYKEWFVDLRFPGYEDCKIVDGVPEEWGYKPLREIMKYVRGKSYTSKELSDSPSGAVMVNLKNIRAFGGYNRNAEKWFLGKYKQDQTLSEGDIVMGVTDMTKERRLVGHVALIPRINEEDVTFSMDLIKIIPLNVTKSYLYSTFYYGGYSRNISSLANGVNVLHLKPESMMELKMLVPNENTQKKYEELFSILQRKIEILQSQIENAAEARNRLLPKLMNGEIEV